MYFQLCLSSKHTEKVCEGTEYTSNQKSCNNDKDCNAGKTKHKCIEIDAPIAIDEIQDKEFECGKEKGEFHFHWYQTIKDYKIGHFKLVGGSQKTFFYIYDKNRKKFKNEDERIAYELTRKYACCSAIAMIKARQQEKTAQGWIYCYNCMEKLWPEEEICGDFKDKC